jgi:hypothetical protein
MALSEYLAASAFDAFDAQGSGGLRMKEAEVALVSLGIDSTMHQLCTSLEAVIDATTGLIPRDRFVSTALSLAPAAGSADDSFAGFALLDGTQTARVNRAALSAAASRGSFLDADVRRAPKVVSRFASYETKGLSLNEYRAVADAAAIPAKKRPTKF